MEKTPFTKYRDECGRIMDEAVKIMFKHDSLGEFLRSVVKVQTEPSNMIFHFDGAAITEEAQERYVEAVNNILKERENCRTDEEAELFASVRREMPFLDSVFASMTTRHNTVVIRQRGMPCYCNGADLMILPPAADFTDVHSQRVIELHEALHWTATRDKDKGRGVAHQHMHMHQKAGNQPGVDALEAMEEAIVEVGSALILMQHAPDTHAKAESVKHFQFRTAALIGKMIFALLETSAIKGLNGPSKPKDQRLSLDAIKTLAGFAADTGWGFPSDVNEMLQKCVRIILNNAVRAAGQLEDAAIEGAA